MGAGGDREHPAASLRGQGNPPQTKVSCLQQSCEQEKKTTTPIPQLPPLAAVHRGGNTTL